MNTLQKLSTFALILASSAKSVGETLHLEKIKHL